MKETHKKDTSSQVVLRVKQIFICLCRFVMLARAAFTNNGSQQQTDNKTSTLVVPII